MSTPQDAVLLRIYLDENDRADGQPAYQAIVLKAREQGLAGATVLRGPLGFGRSGLHTAKILSLSSDLPVVVEIIDNADRIRAFLTLLDPIMSVGLATVEPVQVHRFGTAQPSAP